VTETNQLTLNDTSSELDAMLARLSIDQVRFVVARSEVSTDKEAAQNIRVSPESVKRWKREGAPIDETLRLLAHDGVVTALHLRKRNLAKAMAVKVAGLDDPDSKVRQGVATEVIEWELGSAVQKQEHTVKVVGFDLDRL